MGFWKASSQMPIATNTLPPQRSLREQSLHLLTLFWKYAMWPMALILVCFMVGSIVYFLLSENELDDHRSIVENQDYHGHSHNGNDNERNAINFSNNYSNPPFRPTRPNVTATRENQRFGETIQRPNATAHPNLSYKVGETISSTTRSSSTTVFPKITRPGPTTLRPTSTKTPNYRIVSTATSTTTARSTTRGRFTTTTTTSTSATTSLPETTTKRYRVYTNTGDRRKLPQPAPKHTTLLLPHEDDANDNIVDRSKLLFPSKETLENFGFTSGHQNNFGVPIEEDERILRMLNEEMIKSQQKQNQSGDYQISQTTDANVYHTRVSPTLPNLKKLFATTERIHAPNVSDDGKLQ